jgi:hypothetical protein
MKRTDHLKRFISVLHVFLPAGDMKRSQAEQIMKERDICGGNSSMTSSVMAISN